MLHDVSQEKFDELARLWMEVNKDDAEMKLSKMEESVANMYVLNKVPFQDVRAIFLRCALVNGRLRKGLEKTF